MLAPMVAEKAAKEDPPSAGVGVPLHVPKAVTVGRNTGFCDVTESPPTVMYPVVTLFTATASSREIVRTYPFEVPPKLIEKTLMFEATVLPTRLLVPVMRAFPPMDAFEVVTKAVVGFVNCTVLDVTFPRFTTWAKFAVLDAISTFAIPVILPVASTVIWDT